MSTFTTPRRRNGVAGQIAVETTVTYTYDSIDGGPPIVDEPHQVSLVGSAFGGPVLLVTGPSPEQQIFVSDAVVERIGFAFELDPVSWARAFFHDLTEVPR